MLLADNRLGPTLTPDELLHIRNAWLRCAYGALLRGFRITFWPHASYFDRVTGRVTLVDAHLSEYDCRSELAAAASPEAYASKWIGDRMMQIDATLIRTRYQWDISQRRLDQLAGSSRFDLTQLPATASAAVPAPGHFLVLGGAACVWDDVAELETLLGHAWDGWIIAANDIGVHWPRRLDHWCSAHPENFPKWCAERERNGHAGGYTTWGASDAGQDRTIAPINGSSGVYAIKIAEWCYSEAMTVQPLRIVLCGVPLSTMPHFKESAERHASDEYGNWAGAQSNFEKFRDWLAPRLATAVRSMSGNTREVLGAPTREWLDGQA